MDLLERYLQAIGRYLPHSTRQETLAELRSNLLSEMDERAEAANRPLTDAETAGILRAHGKPETVALRYLPQRSLIGPGIFPFYLLTLRKAFPFVALIYAIAAAARLIFLPSTASSTQNILEVALQFIPTLLYFWTTVTIVFATIEFIQSRPGVAEKSSEWDPSKLPALMQTAATEAWKSRPARILDLAVHCVWIAFVLAIPQHPFLVIGPGTFYLGRLGVTFAPVWHTFYALLLILLALQLVMKIMALRNGPQPWKAPLELVTRLLGIIGISILVFAKSYFMSTSAATDLLKLAAVNHTVNLAFKLVLFIVLIGFVVDTWKYIRRWIPSERLAF